MRTNFLKAGESQAGQGVGAYRGLSQGQDESEKRRSSAGCGKQRSWQLYKFNGEWACVGAGLLAKAVNQPAHLLTDPPPSRASRIVAPPLPHF
ncbi:hypothetical protein GDV60_08560 [Pseudomonas sp. DTU12.1]|nr:hypothetical protein GDV60_08560 [Pseudomonas sp. DTU12.1]